MENVFGRVIADLDELDLQIIRLLQEDGRFSNVAIARRTGVSEPTVRKRVERMIQDGIIRVTAVLNPRTAGYNAGAIIGIRTYPGRAQEVAEQLLPLNEVVYLGYITGRFDLLVELLLPDEEQMLTFLTRRLGDFPGIDTIETFHILRADKINYDWKLPEERVPAARATPIDRRGAGPPRGRQGTGKAPPGNGRRPTRRGTSNPAPAAADAAYGRDHQAESKRVSSFRKGE
ncbi:MAG: Lrp/AsnC family transcriptional regulator [Thermomicrobiales bacterium]